MELLKLLKSKKRPSMSNIISFSVPPHDQKALEQVKILKQHCKATGKNFSHQVLLAIAKHVKDMELTNAN